MLETKISKEAAGRMIAALILGALASVALSCGPPSDSAMERTFHACQRDFDQLRRLIMEDSSVGILLWVSEDRTDPDVEEAFRRGLSQARLEKYRILLRRLRLRAVGRDGNDVVFNAYYSGFEQRGYLYSEDVPQGLEQKPSDLSEPEYSTKFLQERWYLYHYYRVRGG